MKKNIILPMTKEVRETLRAGDMITLTGVMYTARDAAHKRMVASYQETGKLPFSIENAVIYYAGPSPAKEGQVIGSVGPTTSYRMDDYAPTLIQLGLGGMVGKGQRNEAVKQAMIEQKAVYFAATGGAGALISQHIKKVEIIAYEDLGAEAVRRLEVENFPVVVVMDGFGGNLYETEPPKYRK